MGSILRSGCWAAGALLLSVEPSRAADEASQVLVIYNASMPESKDVAAHYAQRRQVPPDRVVGFDLPTSEELSRKDYLDRLEGPLLRLLEERKLWVVSPVARDHGATGRRVVDSKSRYLALCYGVPSKIARDESWVEPRAAALPQELQRNEGSVDSQLVCLPLSLREPLLWAGPIDNPAFNATNTAQLHPTNGVLLVSRLDGPTPEIARSLVDKCMQAETNGLWGRAYIDSRGITNGSYLFGDEWMRVSERVCRIDFETEFDAREETLPAGHPMADVAIYAGWYASHASGAFGRPSIDFMPGAFAYHLHSFSAATLRSTDFNWVGPLLHRGASASIGYVYEPYLTGTANLPVFFGRWLLNHYTLAESAWASMNHLSWQGLVVGDPLYRPTYRDLRELHMELEARQSPLVAWSHLRVISRNVAQGVPLDELIDYLKGLPMVRTNPVLREKLADLYWVEKRFTDALDTLDDVLAMNPSPHQKLRMLLRLAHQRSFFGPDEKALGYYQTLLKEYPDYPDKLGIYEKMLPLARRAEKQDVVAECEREIKRLTPAPPASQ